MPQDHFRSRATTLKGMLAGSLLLAALLVPAVTSAQQVRIIGDETPIRLDPDTSSTVLATMDAQTLLTWVGESGDWHMVSFAPSPGADELLGYVLASQVEMVAGPATPQVPPGLAVLPLARPGAGPGVPDLIQQYERRKRMRSAGVSKIVWGAVFVVSAKAALDYIPPLQEPDPLDFDDADSFQSALDRRESAETATSVVMGLGVALAGWGATQVGFGWKGMRDLELVLPQRPEEPLEVQYAGAVRSQSAGKTKVFWGVFLPAVAYGVVEFVPYFAAPDEADFEDVDEYQDALDRREQAESARGLTTAVGGVLGAWGATQWFLAARKISSVEAAVRTSALSVSMGPTGPTFPAELFVDRVGGGRTEFGIKWRW